MELCSALDGTSIRITNVYAPTRHADKAVFLAELSSLSAGPAIPWLIVGGSL